MSDCVRFEGHIRKSDGYGIVGRSKNNRKRIFLAHRWVWALHNGKDPWEVPGWLQIKQSCKDRACVNPEHLFTEVDDAIIQALPAVMAQDVKGTGLLSDAYTGPELDYQPPPRSPVKTRGAMQHQLRTECPAGHAFREAPDDTPCIPCQILKKQDLDSEVQPA